MSWLDRVTTIAEPGVYVAPPEPDRYAVADEVAARGWRCLADDLSAVTDKATLLAALARAVDAPDYFGGNWDALVDVLRDLSWTPAMGYVVLLDGCGAPLRRCPADWAVALDIFAETVTWWTEHTTPMRFVLRDPDPASGYRAV
ncbi:MAG: barstar family protein [Acidimicrobiia bacterium]|nr:barstar family protein [Acidimicrobiia bacterium]